MTTGTTCGKCGAIHAEGDAAPCAGRAPWRPADAAPDRPVDLTGRLTPFEDGQPVPLSMPGTDDFFVACFSDETRLRSFMQESGIAYDRIKQITNGGEFIGEVLPKARIILDPRRTERGTIRFTEVRLP